MQAWLAANVDYLAFALASLLLFGGLEWWLRHRHPPSKLAWPIWPALAALIISGWFVANWEGRRERAPIEEFMKVIAPTYAQELELMGHAKLTLDTPPDDPNYLAMIEAEKRWLKANPGIADIYTHRRRPDGKVVLLVDSETDYNGDGQFEGEREKRTPLGEVYDEVDDSLLRAFDGESTFTPEPVTDRWGRWVSALVPMRDAQGKVEAVLGVDFPARDWLVANEHGRTRGMAFLAIPLLVLAACSATIALLRAGLRERQAMAAALTESEARLRSAFANVPFEFWMMDAAGHYMLGNSAVKKRWGDYGGKTLKDVDVSAETRAHWAETNARAFAGEVVRGESTHVFDGEPRYFYYVVAPVRIGDQVSGILGVNFDITDRVKAEQARRQSEARLALHVRQTPLAVIEWDLNFRVVAWNPAAERIFGYTAAEALGQVGTDLLVPAQSREQVAGVWAALLANKGGMRSTNLNRHKDGRLIHCEWYNTPLVDEKNGRVIGVASNTQDITEREELENQLRHAQKMETVGQLAGGVAHEFNNLLTPMLLQTEILEGRFAHDPGLMKILRPLQVAIEQATQLAQRILTVGRRSAERREFVPLNAVIENALALLRPGLDSRIELLVSLAPGLAPLWLDRAQIMQVVMNLFLNARDTLLEKLAQHPAAGWHPRLVVATEYLAVPPRRAGGSAAPLKTPYQRLTVTDNGLGISAEAKARVFEPFFTTKAPGRGTGLGLAMVWNIVQGANGWIDFVDAPAGGTSFQVYLPVPAAPAPANDESKTKPVRAASIPAGRPLRILQVEDNLLVGDTISSLLTAARHEVVTARDGEEGWVFFNRHGGRFDVVMADYNMPRLNGVDLVRRLRGVGFAGRIIVLSGYLSTEKLGELKNLGVDAAMRKPLSPAELLAAVETTADQS